MKIKTHCLCAKEIFIVLTIGFISGFVTSQFINDGKKEVIETRVYEGIEQKLDDATNHTKPVGLTPRYEIFGADGNCVLVCKKNRSYKKIVYAGAGDTTLQTRMGK